MGTGTSVYRFNTSSQLDMYFVFRCTECPCQYSYTPLLLASHTLATYFGCNCDRQVAVPFIYTMLTIVCPSLIR